MAGKNDYLPIAPSNTLRVTTSGDGHHNHQDGKNKKKSEPKLDDQTIITNEDELESIELIELGRILLKKRNTEMKLFQNLQLNKENTQPDEQVINILQVKIAQYERDLQELKQNKTIENTEINLTMEDQILYLEKLYSTYLVYNECIIEAKRIININDIEFLDNIIRQKESILNQIDDIRNSIDLSFIKNYSVSKEKKLKADQLLADIHLLINKIIDEDNQNSIQMKKILDKVKISLANIDIEKKTISKYGQKNIKSHFIDKKQ